MRVRCVPERQWLGASGFFFFFLHHTCVSCLLDHDLLKKITEMSQTPAHEDSLLSLFSADESESSVVVSKTCLVLSFCTVKHTISDGLLAIFVLLRFPQFYHSKWAKLGSQTILFLHSEVMHHAHSFKTIKR